MVKDKPITEALRDVIAQEAKEGGSIFKAVEDGVTSVGVVTEKTIEGFRKEVNQRFDKLEAGQMENRRRIDDLKQDTALTPTKEEFANLKSKVNRYHPTAD